MATMKMRRNGSQRSLSVVEPHDKIKVMGVKFYSPIWLFQVKRGSASPYLPFPQAAYLTQNTSHAWRT